MLTKKEEKECTIWDHRPAYCRAFPLAYSGSSFVIEMDDCPGLGSSDGMDKELLKEMRGAAKDTFERIKLMGVTLPLVQAITIRTLQEEQMEALSKLSPEDMEKIKQVFSKIGDEEAPPG